MFRGVQPPQPFDLRGFDLAGAAATGTGMAATRANMASQASQDRLAWAQHSAQRKDRKKSMALQEQALAGQQAAQGIDPGVIKDFVAGKASGQDIFRVMNKRAADQLGLDVQRATALGEVDLTLRKQFSDHERDGTLDSFIKQLAAGTNSEFERLTEIFGGDRKAALDFLKNNMTLDQGIREAEKRKGMAQGDILEQGAEAAKSDTRVTLLTEQDRINLSKTAVKKAQQAVDQGDIEIATGKIILDSLPERIRQETEKGWLQIEQLDQQIQNTGSPELQEYWEAQKAVINVRMNSLVKEAQAKEERAADAAKALAAAEKSENAGQIAVARDALESAQDAADRAWLELPRQIQGITQKATEAMSRKRASRTDPEAGTSNRNRDIAKRRGEEAGAKAQRTLDEMISSGDAIVDYGSE